VLVYTTYFYCRISDCCCFVLTGVAWVVGYYSIGGCGFPVYLKQQASCPLAMVMSRKLILLFSSFSSVNFILGIALLKSSNTLCILVWSSLYRHEACQDIPCFLHDSRARDMFTRATHWPLPWTTCKHFTPPDPSKSYFNNTILCMYMSSKSYFLFSYSYQIFYEFFITHLPCRAGVFIS
jgi:hypothetical protein